MLKIWFRNKYLPGGKKFLPLFILTLILSKEKTILFQTFLPESFCKEKVIKIHYYRIQNEYQQRQWQRYTKGRRLSIPDSNMQHIFTISQLPSFPLQNHSLKPSYKINSWQQLFGPAYWTPFPYQFQINSFPWNN